MVSLLKRLLPPVLALLVLAGGVFAYRFFQKSPPVETKFVQEVEVSTSAPEETFEEIAPVELVQPGEKALLKPTQVSYQTFNNCGPATLSMILSYYGIPKSQKELGEQMRPYQNPQGDNDDKTIFPEEFVAWAQRYGLKSLHHPNGTIQLIKVFVTNGVPVVVKQWLRSNEDIGHFRIVRGFDENDQVIITDDSYFGPNRRTSYYDFLSMWQPFNYAYMPVYTAEQEATVMAILGDEVDEPVAYQKTLARGQKEAELDPENVYPFFNQSTSYYYLGEHEKSVEVFEKVYPRLPRRMLWYQIEPILAYQKLGRYNEALALIDYILTHGNRAFSELYQIRGEIYLAQGNPGAARREFEQALEYNQNFQPANDALGRLP